ncbi:hypothetical protein [Tateyamaria pelophila]|uniref:hypothetical protein n=1 Tax=Tateyamaria pelophila TaxID=328415 RepID=UPI001CC07DB3|nr:hypothetical protein [Tateyamaria pelophila]
MAVLIPREYFTLNEVLEEWGISESELGYVVEMGQLTLSVRIYGSFMVADRKDRSPQCKPDFEGVVDLERRDAMRVLRKQACQVASFALNGGTVMTPEGGTVWVAYRDALLVRACEREQFEETALAVGAPHINDYDRFLAFELDGKHYLFTDMQARALNYLFICAVTGDPEQRGVQILAAAGSASVKLSYLFSSRKGWRDVVHPVSGRRGYYMLEPALVVTMRIGP